MGAENSYTQEMSRQLRLSTYKAKTEIYVPSLTGDTGWPYISPLTVAHTNSAMVRIATLYISRCVCMSP